MGKIKLWKKEEDRFIKNFYSKKGAEFCSIKLNRTIAAVRRRANKLGFSVQYSIGRFNEDNMINSVKKSKNIKEALMSMGLRAAGGNYKIFHEKIEEYGIDTSHFEIKNEVYDRTLKRYISGIKIPLSEILIEKSSYNRTELKKRLYDEGLKERFCEMPGCGQGEEWMGKKMSLILDHINGIHDDNRIENLRIVCPNCNATLPTHAGKNNKKKVEKIIKVDKRIGPKVEKRMTNRPPYEQLEKEIKDLGYSGTGRKYGVSDNAIRKWVKSYEKCGK